MSAPAAVPPLSGASPARVTLAELVALAPAAGGIALDALRARASHHGGWLSPLRGRGMDYDETRRYHPGDDPRVMDWRVTARTGQPHTKLFHEERERPVLLCADLRAPMFFATRGAFKAVVVARAAATLAWAATLQGDRVGGLVTGDDGYRELRPARGRPAVMRWLDALVDSPGWQRAAANGEAAPSMSDVVARVQRVARPGARVFLLGDFHDLSSDALPPLRQLARHGELFLVFVHDRLERELPPPGRYWVRGPGGEWLLDTTGRGLHAAHAARFDARRDALYDLARRSGAHVLECSTEDDPVAMLQRRFARRRGPGGRGG